MQVLFLDFDGVLNSKLHFLMEHELPPVPGADTLSDADLFIMKRHVNVSNMWCLKYILTNVPNLKIVISSAWRLHYDLESFRELFKIYKLDGTKIIGKTPKKMSSIRSEEIRMWLNDYSELHMKTVDWVAVDDHVIFEIMSDMKDNEILTDGWTGLTMHDAFKIIKYFKPDFKEPEILI